MERRATVDKYLKNFSDTLGYGVGDLVTYTPLPNRVIGIVRDIDPQIRKIFVDWGGCGSIHQHDPDELQMTIVQEPKVRDRMASSLIRRVANGIVGDVKTSEFLTQELAGLLNKQFANELANSAFYKVCASWFENQGLPGFRIYFMKQANGESDHAMKVYEFLVDSGVQVEFPAMGEVALPSSLKEVVKSALLRETDTTKNWQIITESAKNAHNAAIDELCQWFMKEQMEEESSVGVLYSKVIKAVDNASIEVIDNLLREEEPTPPIKTASFNRR